MSKTISYVISVCDDVFLDKLPKGVLKAISQEFHTELKAVAKTQKKRCITYPIRNYKKTKKKSASF